MADDDALDRLTRRAADCLERHLPDYGFHPYRYPSGENKSTDLVSPGLVRLYDDAGRTWTVAISESTPAPTTRVAPVRAQPAARRDEEA